jgi:hypothetical protein
MPPAADRLLHFATLDFFTIQRYATLFWPAGQRHDYCYHHGFATYSYSKEDCDSEFLAVTTAICDAKFDDILDWFKKQQCEAAAATMYAAVDVAGQSSYDATNTVVDYLRLSFTPGRVSAVWRPGTEAERHVIGWQEEDFRRVYDELWSQGWRLHLLKAE